MNIPHLLKTKVIRNSDLYRIFISKIKSGPLDGGCWAMAVALQKVIGKGSLYSIVSRGIAQHIVLKVDSKYIDADGISTEKQLLHRWQRFEGLQNPYLRPFSIYDIPDSPRREILVNAVVNHLVAKG